MERLIENICFSNCVLEFGRKFQISKIMELYFKNEYDKKLYAKYIAKVLDIIVY